MEKAIAKYFAAARRHGAKRAEKGTIVIGSSTDTATGQRRTHKLRAGWVAGFLRTAARFGALDDATLTQAQAAGVQLPEPEPPIVDPDGDPDWQTILLRETAKLTQTARLHGGQRHSGANAKATPRHNHLPQRSELEHAPRCTVTGPTVAEIGMKLTRRTDTHPTFGTIDVYATELINDPAAGADNDVEYVVSPDHTVYKRAVESADWSPAGKLIHHVDEILLPRWSPADEALTLTVATALDEAAQDELFPLITAHVLRTQSELVTKIVRDIFSVRRAGIVDTPDDYQAALIRAKRANRRALTPGPEFVAAINTALLKAFQIAATSTAEQTRKTLAQSDPGISAGGVSD
jgi:hypothetical protein